MGESVLPGIREQTVKRNDVPGRPPRSGSQSPARPAAKRLSLLPFCPNHAKTRVRISLPRTVLPLFSDNLFVPAALCKAAHPGCFWKRKRFRI